jgi:2-dehydropantoate 2-reductase
LPRSASPIRRHTEIATLNGGIVREARRHGVPTPLHEAIVDLISGLEYGWSV